MKEEKTVSMKVLGRLFAGWTFSQAFYHEKLYKKALEFKDLEGFMVKICEAWACSKGKLVATMGL